jgi:ubiquinone/menaquinone biosynthesis C-methylase UbiE/catechol 2,3-dioxygenase-like lactoylglutathione lyase family enzyme
MLGRRRIPVIKGIHHAQITVPKGMEDEARSFYCGVLKLIEIEKPISLTGRGGFWVQAGTQELHIETEEGVERSQTKAHLAYEVEDIKFIENRLAEIGIKALESVPLPGYERFEIRDPFGNRVEFIKPTVSQNHHVNKYKNTAHLYDSDDRDIIKDDVNFYLKQATKYSGKILEIACGTGRVTLPLARAGFNVDGFDLSSDMINEFRMKLSQENNEVQKKIQLFQADMTAFSLNKKYQLILIPFRSFQLLTEAEQAIQCLACIQNHLTDDGIFIINVYRPFMHLDDSWVQPETKDWTKTDSKTGITIKRTNIRRKIDLIHQINFPELIYYVTDSEGKEEQFVEKLAMKYYYEDQLRELLLSNGFRIIEEFGYFDERPIQEGPELIFICRKL